RRRAGRQHPSHLPRRRRHQRRLSRHPDRQRRPRAAARAGREAERALSRGLCMNFNDYDIIPVVRELSADALTPVAAFAALSGEGTEAFLLESVERGENVGRYSFVGFDPRRSLRFDQSTPDPVKLLNDELRPLRVYQEGSLPPFFGGAVGFFGYGVAGWSERIPDSHGNGGDVPDARLLFFDNVVVFDHVKQRLYVIANVFTADPHASLDAANARIDRAIERLRGARVNLLAFPAKPEPVEFEASMDRASFERMVRE